MVIRKKVCHESICTFLSILDWKSGLYRHYIIEIRDFETVFGTGYTQHGSYLKQTSLSHVHRGFGKNELLAGLVQKNEENNLITL